jgi:hypothetical protein
VRADHPHFAGICRVATEGIALGFGDGTYRPGLAVSRGQLASFVARTLEQAGFALPPARDQGFVDIADSVHARAIEQLAAVDILQGVVRREQFRPGAPVTRDQLASVLVRAVEWARADERFDASDGPHFTDTVGSVHARNIDLAYELGLTVGTGPREFSPRHPAVRGQTATFLSRLLDTVGTGPGTEVR